MRMCFDYFYGFNFYFYFYIIVYIYGSPSGKKPDLQGAMLKKKKSDLAIYS